MFGSNWSTFLESKESDSAISANSRENNSDSSGQIKSIIELIRDLMVTYIFTKFGADSLHSRIYKY